jgi:hypothetical protein
MGIVDNLVSQLLRKDSEGAPMPVSGKTMWDGVTRLPSHELPARVTKVFGNLLKDMTENLPNVVARDRTSLSGKPFEGFIAGSKRYADAIYDPMTHEVILNPNTYHLWGPGKFASVVGHELLHGMVNNAQLRYSKMSRAEIAKLSPEKQKVAQAVNRIEVLHGLAQSHWRRQHPRASEQVSNLDYHYGLDNPREFAAELITSPRCGRWLDTIPFNAKTYGWEGIKDTLKTAYDAAITQLRDIFGRAGFGERNAVELSVLKQAIVEIQNLAELSKNERRAMSMEDVAGAFDRGVIERQTESAARPGFEDFKDALPDHLKDMAEVLYKQAEKEQNALLNTSPSKGNGGGVWNKIEGFASKPLPYEAVKEALRGEKDIPGDIFEKVGQQLVSGGKMYAAIKGNKIVQYAVDQIGNMMRAKDASAFKILDDPQTGVSTMWSKLKEKEQLSLHKVINDPANWKKRWLSMEQMRNEYGMTGDQINAYMTWRTAAESTLGELNGVWSKEGLPTVDAVPGYFPARWEGAYYAEITDAAGKLVRVEMDNSRRALEKRLEAFKNDPVGQEYTVGKTQTRPRSSDVSNTEKGVRILFSVLTETHGKNSFEAAEL